MHKLIEKYTALKPEMKVSFWYIVCNVVQNGISFITLPLFTRIIPVEEYGTVTLYGSWRGIIAILATFNMASGTFMTAYVKYEKDKYRLISSLQTLTTVITVLFFVIFCLLYSIIDGVLQLPKSFMFLMFLEILVQPAFTMWSTKLKYENRYIPMVVVSIITAILVPVIGFISVSNMRNKAFAKVASATLVFFIIYGSIYIINLYQGKTLYSSKYWKYALGLGIPLIPHYLSLIVLGQSDRIMIAKMCGESYAATYGVGYTVAMVINIIYAGINASLGPTIMKKLKNQDYAGIRNEVNKVLVFMLVILGAISLIYPELMALATPVPYHDVITIMPVITFSIFFNCINNNYAKIEMFFEKKYYIMIASVMTALINIVLNFTFIPRYGYKVAAVTTFVSYALLSLAHFYVYKKVCKSILKIKSIYDDKKVLMMQVVAVIACISCIALYKLAVARAGILILIMFCLVRNREAVFSFLYRKDQEYE